MLLLACVLFVFAVMFGLAILFAIFRGRRTPKPAVFAHGLLALMALGMLIVYVVRWDWHPVLIASAVLFVIAAMGGLTMFSADMRSKPIPKLIVAFHPLLALLALALLIGYVI